MVKNLKKNPSCFSSSVFVSADILLEYAFLGLINMVGSEGDGGGGERRLTP